MPHDQPPGSRAPLQAPFAPAPGPVTACGSGGFWRRFLAAEIDFFLCCLVCGAVLGVLDALLALPTSPVSGGVLLLPIILPCLYGAWAESSRHGATFGKRLLRLEVQDADGARLSLERSAVRQILRFVTFLVLPIAFLCIALTPQKRGLHDLAVGARVVRSRIGAESTWLMRHVPNHMGKWMDKLATVFIALLSILILAGALFRFAIVLLKGLAMQGMPASY